MKVIAQVMVVAIIACWMPQDLAAQSTSQQQQGDRPGSYLAQTFDGPVPDPIPTTIQPRRAAALGALLMVGLLLFLYAHRRRPYILYWVGGWMMPGAAMYLLSRGYPTVPMARMAVGTALFLMTFAGILAIFSAQSFTGREIIKRRYAFALVPVLLWYLFSPVLLGLNAVLIPSYFVGTVIDAAAGILFIRIFRERRILGAGLIGLMLMFLSCSNLMLALMISRVISSGQVALQFLIVNSLFSAFIALGQHLMVFEEMTYELRMANRKLEQAQLELLQLATTDALTGCNNRRFLEQVIERELQRHRRYGMSMSILFVDIDRFKAVNDALGHDVGDRVLQYVASFLKRSIREADYVIRWGGDEFLVLLSCPENEAIRKAAALKTAFDTAPEAVELPPGIRLSVGCVEIPIDTADIMPFVREADLRMYQDKIMRT